MSRTGCIEQVEMAQAGIEARDEDLLVRSAGEPEAFSVFYVADDGDSNRDPQLGSWRREGKMIRKDLIADPDLLDRVLADR